MSVGLRALLLYGLKGVAAYAHHAEVLGERRDAIADGIARALDVLAGNSADLNTLLEEALALGRCNFVAMEALDAANTGTFGTPAPAPVRITPVAGKAILVSGHDLRDLARILEATKGTGINVYTHGEMLPAHGYPKLRAYPHLAGNYGGAWQNQQNEFAAFPGPIVMTSNCLIEPQPTLSQPHLHPGPVGWPGIRHIENGDFGAGRPGGARLARLRRERAGADHYRGLRPRRRARRCRQSDRRRKIRCHQAFLPDRRLRRRGAWPQLLHRVRRGGTVRAMILTLGCGKYRFNKP